MGYEVIASENRSASSRSIEEVYKEEVRLSSIYIGIIGAIFSNPTFNEFQTANENKIPTLVFQKQVTNPDTEVSNFLTKLKDSATGVTIKKFSHIIELRNEVRTAIVHLVSREFRNPTGYDRKLIVGNIKRHNRPPKLGEADIIDFQIPLRVTRGNGNGGLVYTKVLGKAKHAFLDLLLVDPDGIQYWFPNPDNVDSVSDKGLLELDGEYEGKWGFLTTADWKQGSYIAFIGLYEDTYDLPTVNRRLIAFDQKLIEII